MLDKARFKINLISHHKHKCKTILLAILKRVCKRRHICSLLLTVYDNMNTQYKNTIKINRKRQKHGTIC